MASTNVTDVAYVKETVAGTTPASPDFQRLPVTGCNLAEQFTTAVSEALRKDRMVDDLIIVDMDVNGGIPFELTYEAFKPMLISLLQGGAAISTVAIADATDLSITASTKTLGATTTDFLTSNVKVGQFIKIAGFTTAGNNGLFRVASVAQHAVVLEDPLSSLVDEVAGDPVDVTGLCYRNGIAVPDSYTFRKSFSIPGKPEAIFYYRGCQISGMTFNFATGSILNGEMTVTGLTAQGTTTALSGETIDEVADYTLLNSVSSITSLRLEGLPSNAFFSSLNLTVDNGANPQKGLAQLGARGIANFTLNITGTVELYFEDLSVYNIFKSSTGFLMSFTLEDGDGNIMVLTMPKTKFETLTEPVPGKDQFLMESGSIRALRDSVTNCMIQVDFFPAA